MSDKMDAQYLTHCCEAEVQGRDFLMGGPQATCPKCGGITNVTAKSRATPCVLCQVAAGTSRHHLVPRARKDADGRTVRVCLLCHETLHAFLRNKTLAKQYNTIEKLQAAPELQEWLAWRRKHPNLSAAHTKRIGTWHFGTPFEAKLPL